MASHTFAKLFLKDKCDEKEVYPYHSIICVGLNAGDIHHVQFVRLQWSGK
jgi:hypothetical protein